MTRLPFDAGAIVLAGGASRRMGCNKCLLPYGGRPLIEHVCAQLRPLFPEILVSANETETYAFLGLTVVPDTIAGRGPLGGMAAALAQSPYDWNFVVAADIPDIPPELVAELYGHRKGHTCVVPVSAPGRCEPLFAFYHRELLPELQERLASGRFRAQALADLPGACQYPLAESTLRNFNTPDEYRAGSETSGEVR